MRHRPQELQRMSLLLKRIVIRTLSDKLDVGCAELDLLVSADRGNKLALADN